MHKRLLFFDHDSDGGINILFCCRSLLCLFYSLFYFIILFVYNFLQIIFLLFPRVSQQSLTEGSSCNVVFIRNGSHKGIIQFLFHVRSRDHDQTMDNGPKGAPLVKTFLLRRIKKGVKCNQAIRATAMCLGYVEKKLSLWGIAWIGRSFNEGGKYKSHCKV